MKRFIKLFFPVFLSLLSVNLAGQTGTIRGTIVEDNSGETLVGAQIIIKELPGTGTITDLDGAFSLNVKPGTWTVQVRYISYQNLTVENVKVQNGKVNSLGNLILMEDNQVLEEIVVTAEAVKSSEIALLSMRKQSQNLMDGISASKIQLTGDATAVAAVKRVPGVSIEGGKYVYVRGLGDRYSKTTLNGIDIPGLDPDRNTLQMDMFPTSLISNITINKNFTPELPADFTGGLLNIETVDFPEREIIKVSLGVGYNPNSHFNNDFLAYNGGKTDFLGFDDGTRELPSAARSVFIPRPDYNPDQEVEQFIKSFSSDLAAEPKMSLMDISASFSYGNQIELGKDKDETKKQAKLGYLFSLTYKYDYKFYKDAENNEYQKDNTDESIYELIPANLQIGDIGQQSALVGLLGGVAYKTNLSKIRLNLMHLQSGESSAGDFIIRNKEAPGQSGYLGLADILEYNQRSITNIILSGKHVINESGWEINWSASPTISISEDPDIRKTAFTIEIDTSFNAGAAGYPSRIWRSLNEISLMPKVDVSKKHKFLGDDAKLKFGGAFTYKKRDYEILKYNIEFNGPVPSFPDANPNDVLADHNLYPFNDDGVYYATDFNVPNSNQYESNSTNIALYLSEEFSLLENLKGIVGVRMEYFVLKHTGRDIIAAQGGVGGRVLDNEAVLDDVDLFPSINFIYKFSDNLKLRTAYSRTIARPSFKEMSFAQIVDPLSNTIFNGGLFPYEGEWEGNLHETLIDNFDLRGEYFMESGQIMSVSIFYKQFDDPIELFRIPQGSASPEYQPRNVGQGKLYGVEVEMVKGLGFLTPLLDNFTISGNLTFVYSQIKMSDKEYSSRVANAREGEKIEKTRTMAGQSPYVINGGLAYSNLETGLDIGLYYNVKGPTLEIVGTRNIPDIYTKPFHSLNFTANYKFGEDKRMAVDFKASNILDQKEESVFVSYEAADQIYRSRYTGSSYSIGFSYKF
jgi:outer membrane receptor protein involved in Fe transport